MLGSALHGVACHPLCRLITYSLGHCPQPHLSHGNSGGWPGCLSGTELTKPVSWTHWCRAAEVRPQDCCGRTTGLTMGAIELAQTSALPLYVPTETSAAIARPDLPTGAPVMCLHIPLSLQSCQWHINLQITQLLGHSSDFSPAFEVMWPLRISLDFSPSYMCGQPANACMLSELVKVELYPP